MVQLNIVGLAFALAIQSAATLAAPAPIQTTEWSVRELGGYNDALALNVREPEIVTLNVRSPTTLEFREVTGFFDRRELFFELEERAPGDGKDGKKSGVRTKIGQKLRRVCKVGGKIVKGAIKIGKEIHKATKDESGGECWYESVGGDSFGGGGGDFGGGFGGE